MRLDAEHVKVHGDDRVVNLALVVEIGVNVDDEREVLGIGVGLSEDASSWTESLGASVY
ncbi:MAG: transposase [Bacillota bacterium]|nr:transposase [Bacillota bacterium]